MHKKVTNTEEKDFIIKNMRDVGADVTERVRRKKKPKKKDEEPKEGEDDDCDCQHQLADVTAELR